MRASQTISHTPAGAGAIVAELSAKGPMSRQELLSTSGLARTTVVQRLARLFNAGLIRETDRIMAGRGRPTKLIDLDKQSGLIFAVDLGEHHYRLAITDLEPQILLEEVREFDIAADPERTLRSIASELMRMLERSGRGIDAVIGACIGLPAPIDFKAGRPTGPSVVAAWEEQPIAEWMTEYLGLPAYVENDVNLLTLAETRRIGRDSGHFFYVKAGTGIGSGIVSEGALFRGHKGVAGDIGHVHLKSIDAKACRCGKSGCVEAHAAGWAIARDLRAAGIPARDAGDVLRLWRAGDAEAVRLVQEAGYALGEAIAHAVSILNPDCVAIGGTLAATGEDLLRGVREIVKSRALPIATSGLRIVAVDHAPQLALIGAAILVRQIELGPSRAEATVERLMRAQTHTRSASGASESAGFGSAL